METTAAGRTKSLLLSSITVAILYNLEMIATLKDALLDSHLIPPVVMVFLNGLVLSTLFTQCPV